MIAQSQLVYRHKQAEERLRSLNNNKSSVKPQEDFISQRISEMRTKFALGSIHAGQQKQEEDELFSQSSRVPRSDSHHQKTNEIAVIDTRRQGNRSLLKAGAQIISPVMSPKAHKMQSAKRLY